MGGQKGNDGLSRLGSVTASDDMTTYPRQPETERRRRVAGPNPVATDGSKPPGGRLGAGLGISFLSEQDQSEESPLLDEWQRYVEDRLRHYSISHR